MSEDEAGGEEDGEQMDLDSPLCEPGEGAGGRAGDNPQEVRGGSEEIYNFVWALVVALA